jgi:hypothetical protein
MHRLAAIMFSVILISVFTGDIYANSKIYLLPEVEKGNGSLRMSDIAVIEGPEAVSIYDLEIPAAYVKSAGIIDKSDIYEIISKSGFSGFVIFGNGVRVNVRKKSYSLPGSMKDYAVKKGESVDIVVLKNGVRIELQGESLSHGETGETVRVMSGKKKVLSGTVAGKRRVILELK